VTVEGILITANKWLCSLHELNSSSKADNKADLYFSLTLQLPCLVSCSTHGPESCSSGWTVHPGE
jgi:hypothetical protein